MIGDYNLRKRILPAKNYVAAMLSFDFKSGPLQCSDAFFARDARK
jgi:hypothetical protein